MADETYYLYLNNKGKNKQVGKELTSLDEARRLALKRSKPKNSFYWVERKSGDTLVESYDL